MKAMWSKRVRAGCLSMACLLAFTALNLLPAGRGGAAHPVAAEEVPPLKTVYASPAEDWESEALPLGNGFLGAMLFGGVGSDRIQINEHSVWSGGPGASADYDGGVKTGASEAKAALQAVRNELQQTAVSFSQTSEAYIDSNGNVVSSDYPAESQALLNNLEQLKGEKDYFGSYQTLGNLVIQDGSYHIPEIMEITTNGNPSNGSELAVQLFDGDAGTKWYAGDSHANTRPLWIQWKYDQPFTANGYTLTSANDVPGRDPRSWTLSGSNDGTNFTVIDSRGGEAFSDRGQERSFSLSSTVMYTYYRLSITETLTNNLPCQLAEITLQNANPVTESYSDYQRSLNLDEAVANVFYRQDGVAYTREYFISNPGNVMAVRLTADRSGNINKKISVNTEQPNVSISVSGDTITMAGRPSDHTENGLKFAQQVKVVPEGGNLSVENGAIVVNGADAITIYMSAGTNYQVDGSTEYNYFSSEDPLGAVRSRVNTAAAKGYSALRQEHVSDYQALYSRVKVNLGASEIPSKTTDQLLAGYSATNTAAEDRYLETLYYQFGRYLLISCSREGSLPANLQGIWAQGLSSPWSADYHTNINLQMNYWLAEQTNLAECHTPVIDYTNSLVEKGKVMANIYYCRQDGGTVRGWVTHHENNIWGNTAPGNSSAFYFPAAAAWMCQDIWEYYAFNQDKAFLRENYDTMLQAALFWVDNLWTDSRDGTLVSTPSYSPEHGPFSLGATSDQAIIWQLFENVIEASEELEISSPELQEIRTAQSKLSKPSIGLGGQLMEWKDEITLDLTGDGGHRHVNHLYLLHPGNYVVAGRSEQDNAYAEAMKVTLNTRGDEGTGWSKAWKINMWARLRDGDRAQKLLKEQLTGSTLENLFDTHPPFQIDGNFGATAGMTEMLLQSEGDSIDLLAALPSAWPNGSFSGLKARGNFEIDASWENAIAQSFTVKSLSGESCTLRYQELASAQLVRASDGTAVPFTASDNNTITFATDAGETYYLRGLSQDVKVNRPVTFLGVMANNLYNGSIVAETGAPSNNGVYLYDVEGTSFASNVGFRQNDVITRLGGTDIGSTTKLEEVYGAISDGTVVAAVVWRSGTPMTLTFTKTSYEGCIYLPGKIEAEAYDEISGNVRAEGCGEGGQNLGYIVNGDCAVYKNVYFAAVPESFSIRSAGGSPQITLRLDSPSGPIVAQLNPSGTSGWQTYTTSTVDVSNSHLLSGKHDLYLCMNSGININWFSFNGSTGIVPTTGTTEPPEPTEPPTPAGKADLVVTLIGIEPEDPIAGEEVTFRAEIQNVGTGETPAVKHGLSVLVDGVQVNWCDTHVTSLGPGESATLVCNGGPQGKATWSAEAGSHTVEAIIDDVYLIEETEEGNNRLSQTFTSVKAGAGDLVITDVRTSGRPVRGEGTDFNIFVKNEGENAILGAAVEADVYIDARFFRRVRSEELRFMPDGTVMLQAENWKGIYGTHTVRVELNPENGVMETNTANNRRSALVKVADI